MVAKLLLAEDSLTIQKVFELTFKQSGISLTIVDNGIDAVQLAAEIGPDLVVADVSLPGKDGFEVAEALQSAEAGGPRPVLILAGSLAPFNEERFKACGAKAVLFKPFESQELLDRVETLLRGEEAAAATGAEGGWVPPSAEEPWDFSDVLNEVEEETGAALSSRTVMLDELAGGDSPPAGDSGGGGLAFGDFDVSLEEIETAEQREDFLPEAGDTEEIASREDIPEEAFPAAEHIAESVFEDSPPAVTDLTPAIEAIEELGETDLPEVMEPVDEQGESVPPAPEEETVPPSPSAEEVSGRPEPEPAPSPVSTDSPLLDREVREEFSRRAQEIFARVSAEVVEKVMWEAMDALSKEFAEKIRDAVEAAAWEVVPATAEALIREEIARIHEQAEKESS